MARRRLLGGAKPPEKIKLVGAQIVNGCQTSNTIFQNRRVLAGAGGADVFIPTKIIITDDKNVSDAAILALNRQTPIDETRLFTGKNFVDELAWRFSDASAAPANKVLFERRAGEYKDRPAAEQPRVLTLYELARAYALTFLSTSGQVTARRQGEDHQRHPQGHHLRQGPGHRRLLPVRADGVARARSAAQDSRVEEVGAVPRQEPAPPGDAGDRGERRAKRRAAEEDRRRGGQELPEEARLVLTDPVLAGRIADEAAKTVAAIFGGQSGITAKAAARADRMEAVLERAAKVRVGDKRLGAAPQRGKPLRHRAPGARNRRPRGRWRRGCPPGGSGGLGR